MEGKRFGVGLAAGLLLGLALVAVSGGFGSTPLAQFGPNLGAAGTTEMTSTSTTAVASSTIPTVIYTVSATTSNGGSSTPSLSTNSTTPYTSASTTTFSITSTSTLSTTSTQAGTTSGSPAGQSAGTSANSATDGSVAPGVKANPSHLVSILQQPIMSNAEILVPVLVAFLLGAFLYRVTREGGRSDAED
ncbi:MAG TPA: hypothetical protein VLY82_01950 [Nitrososphaerales archaeon]|nr:hypothetical protein [Nitrososphaerales archaeon]